MFSDEFFKDASKDIRMAYLLGAKDILDFIFKLSENEPEIAETKLLRVTEDLNNLLMKEVLDD